MTDREAIERLVAAVEGLVHETRLLSERVYACELSIIEGSPQRVIAQVEKALAHDRNTSTGGRHTRG